MKITITLLLGILSLNLNAQYKNNTWKVVRLEYEAEVDSVFFKFVRVINRINNTDSTIVIRQIGDTLRLENICDSGKLNPWFKYSDYTHIFGIIDTFNNFAINYPIDNRKACRIFKIKSYEDRWQNRKSEWEFGYTWTSYAKIAFATTRTRGGLFRNHRLENQITHLYISTSDSGYRLHFRLYTYFDIPVRYIGIVYGKTAPNLNRTFHQEYFILKKVYVIE
jgi:hypothetical protein